MKKPLTIFIFSLFALTGCNSPSKHTLADKEIMVPLSTSQTQEGSPVTEMKNCLCPQLWLPVCAENGKTYSNSCFAKCADVKFKQGSCAKIITD
ncbi:MAG: hypothetical protein KBD76_03320 [Bacteriovorax sp.]|nr:hypothetical protein [Bacteriovorax sp.]